CLPKTAWPPTSPAPAAGGAATGTISGRVTERATQRPAPGARVSIVGQTRSVLTNDEGQYRLGGLPPGTYTVRALRLGSEAATLQVAVAAGQTATADFALAQSAVALEQVTVTATGAQIQTKETGNAVSTIAPTVDALAASANVTDLLTSRAPGVYVQQSSGTAGAGSRIRVRGANSVSLTNEPLLIIDGVRANNDVGNRQVANGGIGTNVGTGGQVVSRLNDINPEDIESIDIIKGPAGVALYGTAAANGVVQITTKRGRAGATQWRGYAERRGVDLDYFDFPANFGTRGTLTNGTATTNCNLDRRTRALCTASELISFNPIEVVDPLRAGMGVAGGVSASGGSERVNYFLSGDYEREEGVYLTNNWKKTGLRANLRGQLRDNWDVAVNSGYVTNALQLPVNDNSTLGIISTGLLGNPVDDPVGRGFFNGFTPSQLYNLSNRQRVDRYITSVSSNLQALPWLSFSGVAGLDYVDEVTKQVIEPGRVFFADYAQGSANSNPLQIYNYTAQGNATATFARDRFRFTTTAGAQYAQERYRGTNAFGAVLTGGTGSLNGASSRFQVSDFNTDNKLLGGFLQQQVAFADRLFLTAAVRTDDNSAFGERSGRVYYPSLNASWVVSDEGFFPATPLLGSLRLRAAVGRSGQRPRFRDAITYYQPTAVRQDDAEVGAITFFNPTLQGGVGNLDLRPELTTEYEAGFDAAFLRERVNLQFTYYRKTTEDALILRPLAPSVGAATSRFENIGRTRNQGLEVQLQTTLVDTRPVRFEVQVGGSTNDNKLLALGEGIAPIVFNGGRQIHRSGYPLGGYWQRSYTYEDRNGDGIVSRANCPGQTQVPNSGACEITLTDTAVYLGNPLPRREFQVSPRLSLFDNAVRVSALADYRGGFKTLNLTNRFRCVFVLNCRAIQDPGTPLEDQAAALAGIIGTDGGYVEDGSFVRLREVSVTALVPQRWVRLARGRELSLTLAGRNLATWTDYKGLDPEITSTPGANFTSSDFLTTPPARVFSARLNLAF
ncbi:SusC/RagA family TonB-linked outer membrane protein, partial [Roseisolibacter sp. H3M3-2]|uniref:SusC/RagA family TonB-linked outer membrane protein n=1 Tax=Roseisolibacter sp. H3M3-2 TaxID=3031323 RepID=UPI0023DC3F6E